MDEIVTIKLAILGLMAFLMAEFGLIAPTAIILCIAMTLDYITGMIASVVRKKKNPEAHKAGLNSAIGVLGIFKKLGYLVGVTVGLCLDWIIMLISQQLELPVEVGTFFGLMVCLWFLSNELISILENLYDADVKLPSFLMKMMQVLKASVERKGTSMVSAFIKEEEKKE